MTVRLSLRHILFVTLFMFGVIVAAGQFTFIVRTYASEAHAQLEAIVRHAGGTLAANLEAALRENDELYVAHLLAQQITLPHLVHATLVGGDERLIGSTLAGVVGGAFAAGVVPEPPATLVQLARRTLGAQLMDDPGQDRMWGVFPVRLPATAGEVRAREVGYVVLLIDTAPQRRAAFHQALGQSLVVLLPILLLSFGIGFMVKRVLTDRIEQLLCYIRSQAQGVPLPKPLSGGDELGQLGTELSALMKEVLDSRDYHIRLLECMPNPIWRAGPDGKANYFNRAWLAFTGRRIDQELGDGWAEGVHPDDRSACLEIYRGALARQAPFAMEYRLRFCDGSYHWLADHGEPLFDTDGGFAGYVGSCFDIQQDKDAAAAMASSEARFRGLVERTLVGVYLIQNGKMLYTNPRFAEWFGYTPETIVGVGVEQLVHPDDRQLVSEKLRLRETGSVEYVQYAFRATRRDGSVFPVEVYGTRIDYEGGQAVIGTLLDLTERERAQAALKAAAEVVEASPTVLFRWRLEPGWPVSYVSENVHRWGYTAAQLLDPDFRFAELVHPDDATRLSQDVVDYLDAGVSEYSQEYRIRTASGAYIWIEDLTNVLRGTDGVPLYVEGLVTDITERKEAELGLHQLNAELEARVAHRTAQLAVLNKELETFAYSVSHDLKAPLRGIDGYSHLLLEDYSDRLDDEGRIFVRNIRAGVKQMARLIDDLLAYSRMERRSLQRMDVNLGDVVRGILAERVAELEKGPATIDVDVPDMLVKADPEGLAQVLRNLVDNALKYAGNANPPHILIRAWEQEDICRLFVQDNGIGFDMKFHDRIFEIFQRLQRAEDYAGTGVGLAIVRRAMLRMGGRVWAESAVGEGASFHLEFPR
ncbi:MAG: PAS domain S-box protein [Azoarcus sp.]|nr:PAS domain S-box protein [Azoarcus sp.]